MKGALCISMSFTEILNPTEAFTRYMDEDDFAQLVKCEIVMPSL